MLQDPKKKGLLESLPPSPLRDAALFIHQFWRILICESIVSSELQSKHFVNIQKKESYFLRLQKLLLENAERELAKECNNKGSEQNQLTFTKSSFLAEIEGGTL